MHLTLHVPTPRNPAAKYYGIQPDVFNGGPDSPAITVYATANLFAFGLRTHLENAQKLGDGVITISLKDGIELT